MSTLMLLSAAKAPASSGWPPAAIATLIAATIAGLMALVVHVLNTRQKRREQRSALYAEALRPVQAYQEMPYAIRRRRHEPEHESGERTRLDGELRSIQADLKHQEALLRMEGRTEIVRAYQRLVQKMREVAGGYMKDAWTTPAITSDEEMNMKLPFDYSPLKAYEDEFIEAAKKDLQRGYPWFR